MDISDDAMVMRLEELAHEMSETAFCMESRWPDKAKELLGASKIAENWANRIAWEGDIDGR